MKDLPPLFLSYLPILLPVVLISCVSLLKVLGSQGFELGVLAPQWKIKTIVFFLFGEPNIAMALAALVSVILLVRQKTIIKKMKSRP